MTWRSPFVSWKGAGPVQELVLGSRTNRYTCSLDVRRMLEALIRLGEGWGCLFKAECGRLYMPGIQKD